MNEKLLQFIWLHRRYARQVLFTTAQVPVEVLYPGTLNHNQGPDFLNARIRIGGTVWIGHVELHVRSSDWDLHRHASDQLYRNIILHVVWQHDRECNISFPTLELRGMVSGQLIRNYDLLMQPGAFIPCEQQLPAISGSLVRQWGEGLLLERIRQKTYVIEQSLLRSHYHWEEIFWQYLARNFGYPVNQDVFFAMAESIPVTWLSKYKKQRVVLEALFMGQAGLLEKYYGDAYPQLLQREYRFLQKKYGIGPVYVPVKFLRMRPANFPTIRLAQLASLVHRSSHLFTAIRETAELEDARHLFQVEAGAYWTDHYMPDTHSKHSVKWLGSQMINNLFINTIIPFLFLYGKLNRQEFLVKRALDWMQEMPPESNRILEAFCKLGFPNNHAADSQSWLHLKKNYCDARRCLQCALGNAVLSGK